MNAFAYTVAANEADFENAKKLFREYAGSLTIDLDFQHFAGELDTIAQMYGSPGGLLLLVYDGPSAIACAAYRKIKEDTCELKRMYVQPEYRNHKIGRQLLSMLMEHAKRKGYTFMKLDTLASMASAQKIYHDHGFYEIPAYYFNPNKGVVYMEKRL